MQSHDTDERLDVGQNMLYQQFAEPLLTYVCQQVAHRQDAEDLLLEVFLAALQNRPFATLPAPRQLAWLRRVARNKIIDHYRHTALFTFQPLDLIQELEDHRLTPEQQAEQQEQWACLAQAIERLSPDQQELIRLRYEQELRLSQIAAVMGKSEATVRTMLSRTLRRLQTVYHQAERRSHHAG